MLGIHAKQLIILKCIGADGIGTEENLIDALQWIRNHNEHNNPKIADVVLSLGKYNKRGFGLLACDGTCKLCCEAMETLKECKTFRGRRQPGRQNRLSRPRGLPAIQAEHFCGHPTR
jgi:hypothetical protein